MVNTVKSSLKDFEKPEANEKNREQTVSGIVGGMAESEGAIVLRQATRASQKKRRIAVLAIIDLSFRLCDDLYLT